MSEHYQVIAVKANLPEVRAALDRFAQSLNGRAHTISYENASWDATTYYLFKHGEWTALEADIGLMPALAIHLSNDMQIDVFCRDHYSTVGYEHFSHLHAGEVAFLFTSLDDFLEMHGINPAEFVACIRPDEFKIAAGDDPAGADFQFYAPGIFCRFIAPFDIDEFFWSSLDVGSSPLECVRLDLPTPAHRYQLGGISGGSNGLSWHTVLARTRSDRNP